MRRWPSDKKKITCINLNQINFLIKNKKINVSEKINIQSLIKIKAIKKNSSKLKILGMGEFKEAINIDADFISGSAKSKIEKNGGSITLKKSK